MARRKIHTKIEDLRKLVVSEIAVCKINRKENSRRGHWSNCVENESMLNTYEFILQEIDAVPFEAPVFVDEIFV